MIHDIIVPVRPDADREPWPAENYALQLASHCGAHVTAMSPSFAPEVPSAWGIEIGAAWIEQLQQRSDEAAQAALSRFEECGRIAGIPCRHAVVQSGPTRFADLFALRARTCNLAVVPQPVEESLWEGELVEAALFGSGRPILVVPYIHRGPVRLDRALVAWDGSKEAARTVHDALPLLRQSRNVAIVTIRTDHDDLDDASPGTELAAHLARCGLDATATNLGGEDIGVADVLLSHAADHAADLTVMGGYAHSRLRGLVFGSATRGLLASMTAPVLMAH